MRKLLLAPALLLALGLAACDESYDAVDGSPPQVLVQDAGDKIDARNVREACDHYNGGKVVRVQYAGNGRTAALVTCSQ